MATARRIQVSMYSFSRLMRGKRTVLVRVSIAVMEHHDEEEIWGGKGLFSLYVHIAVNHQRKSGQELTQTRNQKVGTDAEDMEGCCLLACFPWPTQPVFL